MITKEKFTSILETIKLSDEKERKFSKAMEEISGSYFISELTYSVTTVLLLLLKDIFDDKEDWIGYCMYEKDWFTKDMEATYKDGSVIPLNNISELYDFLIENMKGK